MNAANGLDAQEIENLQKSAKDAILAIDSLTPEQLLTKTTDVGEMIKYYSGLTETMEGRRVGLHDLSYQLLGISLAGIGLMSQGNLADWLRSGLIWAFIAQALASLVSLVVFMKQSTYRYPFLRLTDIGGNQWKWFYHGNPSIKDIVPRALCPERRSARTQAPYLRGLAFFVSNYVSESPTERLKADLQQLYLLQVHNYYKNRWYLSLARLRTWSLVATVVVFVTASASVALLP
jgi:hypothetical protein